MQPCTNIDALVKRIAEDFRPDRIILFGSRARGDEREDSDTDLLVVLEFEGSNYIKAAEIYAKARPVFDVDILVHRPEDLRKRLDMGDPIVTEAVNHGLVVHPAAA
ncbi:MAG: nucleotidyltransferase domain-containing protein [Phycisphaerales bacterium]|nr:nucleotidyltransferase domain-containing protein [Phycisphaerales bacterium]